MKVNLAAVRDLSHFLTAERPAAGGWQLVAVADVEAFLATVGDPGYRARLLHALRAFFRWARTRRIVLVDPTRGLRANSNIPFHGRVLDVAEQRRLFRRWTAEAAMLHPYEPAVGLLLGLLHGVSVDELRQLHADDVDLAARTIRLDHRPGPTPLDPVTLTAVRRSLAHRAGRGVEGNPHLLVNRRTKLHAGPVSAATYLERLLAPAEVSPLPLRVTRLRRARAAERSKYQRELPDAEATYRRTVR